MDKIKNIQVSYWFKELKYNPSIYVNELEDEVHSIIDTPLMYNDNNYLNNISIPRIQGMSEDKKFFFTMSLVNAFFSININNDISVDEAILLVNNNIQLFYDIIKKIYDVDVIYTSIRFEIINDAKNSKENLIKLFKLSPKDYEDLSFKIGFIKDSYYINYILSFTKEYNFNIPREKESTERDLFDRSMLTSISEAELKNKFLLTVVEINDRYEYNKNKNHETSKDDLRGMIIELKDILSNKLYNKI